MIPLRFEVFGDPQTQGSSRAFVRGGRAIVTSDSPNLRPWRDAVTWAARDAMEASGWSMLTGPVFCSTDFYLPRPKSAPKTRDILPAKGKDVDKMVRSIYDSLTNAGVWRDDSQVVEARMGKRYAVGPDLPKIYVAGYHRVEPGVVIVVKEVE